MNPIIKQQIVVGSCAALAFYVGIFIRKLALSGPDSPPLWQQLLLGIPIFLVVIAPIFPVLAASATSETLPAFLVTLGIIIEHGMLVTEAATDRLNKLRQRLAA